MIRSHRGFSPTGKLSGLSLEELVDEASKFTEVEDDELQWVIVGGVRVGAVRGHRARLASAFHCEPGELIELNAMRSQTVAASRFGRSRPNLTSSATGSSNKH